MNDKTLVQESFMDDEEKQRLKLRGLGVMAIGIGVIAGNWWFMSGGEHQFFSLAAFAGPMAMSMGLAVAIHPRRSTELSCWSEMPLFHKSFMVVGIAAGALNWALMKGVL